MADTDEENQPRLGRFSWSPGDIVFLEELEEDTPEEALRKALSAAQLTAGNYKKDHRKFQGMDITIENKAGSVRRGISKDGSHEWQTDMHNDYGYIKRTAGVDGDHVDVYLGSSEDAPYAYVVHQCKPDTGKYDEDKVMLGFDSEAEAKEAYLTHYDSPKFFGAITVVPMSLFKERVFANKGEPVVPDGPDRAMHKSLFNSDWVG